MSLSGVMGIGISSAGAQNPWDANSPAAVDFHRAESVEVESKAMTVSKPSEPADFVTLRSGEVQVGSAAVAPGEVRSTFRTVA